MEKMYLFPEFELRLRDNRKINRNIAAHVIGYIAEVSAADIQRDSSYKIGDYIGKIGLEKSYEQVLRGDHGYDLYVADSKNVLKESYRSGENDKKAVSGQNINLTIDAQLQGYAERLMQGKKGSVVAIEPSTGEVLAFVSSPTYDPNLLVGRYRSENYRNLSADDTLRPLFNRSLMAEYPPGSIFKLIQSLIALDMGVIHEGTGFACNKSLVGCHDHSYPSDVSKAIQFSCNPYFYHVFKRILQPVNYYGKKKFSAQMLDVWRTKVASFGLGNRLGIDLPGERKGKIPSKKYYDKVYGQGAWKYPTIYSLSIGQGELLVTPLQMANMAAIMANRGVYYKPRLVKSIQHSSLDSTYTQKHKALVSSYYFDQVIEGMSKVVNQAGGTARRAKIEEIEVCGKTGTAQNPAGEDHSIFIAFAPRENPQIAISVYIENAGFGGTWAAPIASLVMQKYLTGSVDKKKEQRILEKRFY